ncbi:biotin-dependent carboxyltransferase family protein [Pedobacter sp. Leaf176]|uniref:5-oxoprolinase subunit C family protein n=1 Tax=Pedobacter sp. Leaf176 TaxID=1736286 RepID=UPI000B1E5315|nr:biotin-dependent carboxyltransferase family protein [Pedobacter sp. Leaf176]
MMEISFSKPGILTTVQDNGRKNYLDQAVPLSGTLDNLSARIANIAIGNHEDVASLEFTYAAAEFRAETDILIAYAGDGAFLIANGLKLPSERPVFLPAGTIIKLINNPEGATTYLSIAGGFDLPEALESKSTYLLGNFGGLDGRSLKTGDRLFNAENISSLSQSIIKSLKGTQISWPSWYIPRSYFLPADRNTIRIFPAEEFTWFNSDSIINFLSKDFSVGLNSNRMGIQISGNKISRRKQDELLSTAVCPGTIQVTGAGEMILLMADCQTTGGYPRIGQVAAVDLPLCAQLKPNDSLRFTEISRDDAEILYIAQEKELEKFKLAIESKF